MAFSKANIERMLIQEANAALNARIRENKLKSKRNNTIELYKKTAINRKLIDKNKIELQKKLDMCHMETKRLKDVMTNASKYHQKAMENQKKLLKKNNSFMKKMEAHSKKFSKIPFPPKRSMRAI